MTTPGNFAAVFAALYVAHQVADHWVQSDGQACKKGQPGWAGRRACAAHVATYALTAVISLGILFVATGETGSWPHLIVGLAVSAITHYIADRRTPLRRIADATGSGRFYRLADHGMNGSYLLDQSWHIGWLFIAALVIA